MPHLREIPYNYTSLSDREIIVRFLGQSAWALIEQLRESRRTGRSARMLFEVLGDMWVVQRNPFIQDDLLHNRSRREDLFKALHHRLDQVKQRFDNNPQAAELEARTRQSVYDFSAALDNQRRQRKQLKQALHKITATDNLSFDGLSRVSHSTDATDWRVEMPLAVLTPDTEKELPAVVQACMALQLPIIPRGGGTGYTGSAVPLHDNAVVLNTEKLLGLGSVQRQILPELTTEQSHSVRTIRVEAGVVTANVAHQANQAGWVFAVDPTSQDASTIGGNIAMNAGGKKAVLWGTTLDNLLSWRMIIPKVTAGEAKPSVEWLEVERLQHNLGKIHEQKIVRFRLSRYAADGQTLLSKPTELSVEGAALRCVGLGKDVTDKALFSIPGVQKEGCDGLITSAVFILHPKSRHIRTVCMEFFGSVRHSVPAIEEIIADLKQNSAVKLAGLEHLDERYVKAVKYSTKAARPELPKMVLLADLISDDAEAVDAAAAKVVLLTQAREGEGFIATSPEARQRFWAERKRTAAIAAHTNAFKINEDVVIPLARLGDYSDGIERMNIVQSTQNKLRMIVALRAYLKTEIQGHHADEAAYLNSAENQQIALAKKQRALSLLDEVENHWQCALDHLDEPVSAQPQLLAFFPAVAEDNTIFDVLQSRQWRVSYQKAIAQPLKDIFSGEHLAAVRTQFDAIHTEILASRLFIALHMHAGDGNVHTNIPVNSHDYKMLQTAELMVDQIMALTQSLGGVISGEHGIGLTKWQYLSAEKRAAFAVYKKNVDPQGFFNRDKLLAGAGLERAYTPSLRLLSQEALILEATDLGDLNTSIKDCLRCGKCKPHCTTHVPEANLLYSPRDKILATGLLIEAVLYEEQTRRGISMHHFDAMNDVADHCTVCHRCFNPCPVDIDFGDVTIKMRNILRQQKKKHFNPIAWASLQFLNVSHPTVIKWMRLGMIQAGYLGQRLAYHGAKYLGLNKPKQPVKTTGHTAIITQVVNFIDKPLPKDVPAQPLRHLLKIEDETKVAIIRDPHKVTENSDAVFYFPGCGSERLFSQIGMATLAMLHDLGTQTVLPPGYLCCGYPQTAAGQTEKGQQISTANRVLFHRVANTLNYLDIKTVLVSCGTCMDQLLKYEFEQIFPNCRLLDIHEYLMEKGVQIEGVSGTKYLYHEPCHTPMKTYHSSQVAEKLLKQTVPVTDRCCGEAGTFAIARPDIAMQVRLRKQTTLLADKAALNIAEKQPVKVLTSCPACQQGLARFTDDTAMETDYIVVELAQQKWGKTWQKDFLQRIAPSEGGQSGIEQVLL